MDLGLKGRGALVAAASKGLGRACAEALIGEAGWSAADVSKPGDPEALVNATVSRLSSLDVLVVNAGGPPQGTFETTPLDNWEIAFHLTLMSAVRLVRAGLPHLKRSEQGRIVFITSISVRQPIPNIALSNA